MLYIAIRMAKVPLPLRIDEDLLSRIDTARGDVPRTRFVVRALEAALATGLRQAVTPAQSEDPHARLSPSGSSAPPVVPDPSMASTLECPNEPDHPLGWSERRGYVCAVCMNTQAVPR